MTARQARARGIIAPGETVAIVSTGTGLKDPGAVERGTTLAAPMDLPGDVEEALAAIAGRLTAARGPSLR